MSEWIVDTTRYERDYGITDHTQALIALSVDLTTLLGCEPVGELVRCGECWRGSDIGAGDLVHCKLLDRMMLRVDYCSMGARKS